MEHPELVMKFLTVLGGTSDFKRSSTISGISRVKRPLC